MKILQDFELENKRSIPVLEVTKELKTFAIELFAKMQLSNGIGLSAPQVGRYISFIVFDVINYTMNAMDSGYMFNAEIIEQSQELVTAQEGCLSFPGEYCQVKRPKWVKIKFLSLANEEVVQTYSGMAARVICHEIDHLFGVTMKDRELQNDQQLN